MRRLFDFVIWYIREHELSFAEWLVVFLVLGLFTAIVAIHLAALTETGIERLFDPLAP